jgi:hypothetical protein
MGIIPVQLTLRSSFLLIWLAAAVFSPFFVRTIMYRQVDFAGLAARLGATALSPGARPPHGRTPKKGFPLLDPARQAKEW